jgi:hypothetical protein
MSLASMVDEINEQTQPSEINDYEKLLIGPAYGANYGLDFAAHPLIVLIVQWAKVKGIRLMFSSSPLEVLKDNYVHLELRSLETPMNQIPFPGISLSHKVTLMSSFRPHLSTSALIMPGLHQVVNTTFLALYVMVLLGVGTLITWMQSDQFSGSSVIRSWWDSVFAPIMGLKAAQFLGPRQYLVSKYMAFGVCLLMNIPALELIRGGLTSALIYQPQPAVKSIEDALTLYETRGVKFFYGESTKRLALKTIGDSMDHAAIMIRRLFSAQTPNGLVANKEFNYIYKLIEDQKAIFVAISPINEMVATYFEKTRGFYLAERRYLPALATWGLIGRNVTYSKELTQIMKYWDEMGLIKLHALEFHEAYREVSRISFGVEKGVIDRGSESGNISGQGCSLGELSVSFVLLLSGLTFVSLTLAAERLSKAF